MIEAIKRSWNLTKESYAVLMQDKELMIFPVISAILTIIVLASFIVPTAIFWGAIEQALHLDDTAHNIISVVVLFIAYFISYFIIIFFNVAILHCANIRFSGGDPTVKDGFDAGMKNIGRIAAWATLSGTIGTLLAMLEDKLGALGGIVRKLVGGAWTIVTYFAVPVLIFEKTNPMDAIKKSGSIIKETWGEGLTMYVGFSAIQGLFMFLSFIPLVGGIALGAVTGSWIITAIIAALVVLSWVAIAVIFSTLGQIFRAALYIYATTGSVPAAFSENNIADAFKVK